jgi:predicted small lipoprotein YifL
VVSVVSVVSVLIVTTACGKKGPPLPPLVKVPAPPGDFIAERRGGAVDLRFTVPTANADGTRPANVERVDVYAFTGSAIVSDDQLLKLATKVGSVAVKAPRDPEMTVEEESEDEIEPPEGAGLDQGATARVSEPLTAAALEPIEIPDRRSKRAAADGGARPLVGAPQTPPIRTYVAVGIAKRGRKGALSKRVTVPLIAPPPAPSAPTIVYNERQITISWTPPATIGSTNASDHAETLPSHPIGGASGPEIGYHVYQAGPDGETRLTKSPVSESKYTDTKLTFGAERCYTVRTVATIGSLAVESDATPRTCKTPVDTFAPAAPKELHAVAGEGTINLIWEPNNENDLAGYVVLRGIAPGETLERLTPAPILDARFTDTVQPGVRYVYAVQAVDKAGNISPSSNRVEETAR